MLIWAAYKNHKEVVTELLEAKANIEAKDNVSDKCMMMQCQPCLKCRAVILLIVVIV